MNTFLHILVAEFDLGIETWLQGYFTLLRLCFARGFEHIQSIHSVF